MNCWEALYMQVFRQHKILITEQQVSDPNPLYELVNTQRILPRNSQPVSRSKAQDAHPQSVTLSNIPSHNKVSKKLASAQ